MVINKDVIYIEILLTLSSSMLSMTLAAPLDTNTLGCSVNFSIDVALNDVSIGRRLNDWVWTSTEEQPSMVRTEVVLGGRVVSGPAGPR